MKKILLLFVTILTLALAGCGSNSSDENGEIKNGTYKISDSTFVFNDEVPNDVTGNWRLATTDTACDVTEYAVEYYQTLFSDNTEVHAIINKKFNTTTRINAISDDLLYVTVYDYVTNEEKDAKNLFTGTVLDEYQITVSTGAIEKMK